MDPHGFPLVSDDDDENDDEDSYERFLREQHARNDDPPPADASTLINEDKIPPAVSSTPFSMLPPAQTASKPVDASVTKPTMKMTVKKQSVLHRHMEQESWNGLLKHLHYLKSQSPPKIQAALEVTNAAADDGTPLHIAVWKAPVELTKLMINILPVEAREMILGKADANGNLPIHLVCANWTTNNASDASVLTALIMGMPESLAVENHHGDLPLHLLVTSQAVCGHKVHVQDHKQIAAQAVASMLQGNADLATKTNQDGVTALHSALARGASTPVAVALVRACPQAVRITDPSGQLPLHYLAALAARQPTLDYLTVAQALVKAYPEACLATCKNGRTPLHVYAMSSFDSSNDSIGLLESLLGAVLARNDPSRSPLFVQDKDLLTPLHCCALYQISPTITRMLMSHWRKHYGDSKLPTDNHGATPSHLACASSAVQDSMEIVQAVLTTEDLFVADLAGRTPLHIVAANPDASRSLVKALIDLDPRPTKLADGYGRLPLHVALQAQADESVAKALLKVYPKASRTVLPQTGGTALHEACQHQASLSIIKSLLKEREEAAEMVDHQGNTPLHLATAFQADEDIVEIVYNAYPDSAMKKNNHGDVPLHYASSYPETVESAKFLVQVQPAAVGVVNAENETPLDCARFAQMPSSFVKILAKQAKKYGDVTTFGDSFASETSISINFEDTVADTRKKSKKKASRARSRSKRRSSKSSVSSSDESVDSSQGAVKTKNRSRSKSVKQRRSRSKSVKKRSRSKSVKRKDKQQADPPAAVEVGSTRPPLAAKIPSPTGGARPVTPTSRRRAKSVRNLMTLVEPEEEDNNTNLKAPLSAPSARKGLRAASKQQQQQRIALPGLPLGGEKPASPRPRAAPKGTRVAGLTRAASRSQLLDDMLGESQRGGLTDP